MKDLNDAREILLSIFRSGISRVEGRSAVSRCLERLTDVSTCSVIAVGKAAQAMALGAVDVLGKGLIDGLVISKPGHLDAALLEAHGLIGLEGGHPLPDEGSLAAGQALLDYIAGLPDGRPLLILISGGASSLVEVLVDPVNLDDLQKVNKWLLASGLSIHKMNLVRKALSEIKGGGLLNYLGDRPVSALLISDVVGDDPAVIGSGLLVPDPTVEESVAALPLPEWMGQLVKFRKWRTPNSGKLPDIHVVARLNDAITDAREAACSLGYEVHASLATIDAEAETVGRRLALELLDAIPGVYIWGGEPTVKLPPNPGVGGRNQHLALAAALVIEGVDDVCLLSAGTDGTDGPGQHAGALVDGGTLGRGRKSGLDAEKALLAADSGSFLAASGDLIQTGPTGTNVMDLIIGMKLGAGQTNG